MAGSDIKGCVCCRGESLQALSCEHEQNQNQNHSLSYEPGAARLM